MSRSYDLPDPGIPLDHTSQLLIQHLKEHMGKEPEAPDPEVHTGSYLGMMARRYDEWDRIRSGLFGLIGARLVRAALELDEDEDEVDGTSGI